MITQSVHNNNPSYLQVDLQPTLSVGNWKLLPSFMLCRCMCRTRQRSSAAFLLSTGLLHSRIVWCTWCPLGILGQNTEYRLPRARCADYTLSFTLNLLTPSVGIYTLGRYLQPVQSARWTGLLRNARICYKIIGFPMHTYVEITKKPNMPVQNVIKQRHNNDRLDVHIIKMISPIMKCTTKVCNLKTVI